MAYILPLKFI